MSRVSNSQLLSESYDRELTEEEKSVLEIAYVSEPGLLELKKVLDRVRQGCLHEGNHEIEIVSRPLDNVHLSEAKKLEIELRFQAAIEKESVLGPVTYEPAKQLREVAFASAAIDNGALTHEQLDVIAEGWSAYGDVSLRDHMVSEDVISSEEAGRFEALADETVLGLDGFETKVGLSQSNALGSIATALGVSLNSFDGLENSKLTIAGDYTLIRKIGGGLGSVWLAKDESLGRTVVVKTIRRSADPSDALFQRFVREAVITSKLEHPNIVTIYQYGEDARTGNFFYAMKFLGKRTLQDVIQEFHQRKLDGVSTKGDLQKLLSAFKTVCQAIGFAHSKGVVHRDLKPQNIAMDDFGQVSVLDWGLAKIHHDNELIDGLASTFSQSFAVENTLQGNVLGTPLYMAPEQAAGRIHQIDERTDVFGLGGILFEILTGKPPHFRSEMVLTQDRKIDKLLSEIVQRDSPVISDFVEDVHPGLAAICERAISKNRLSRYSSGLELSEAVEEWIDGVANRIKVQETLRSVVCDLETRFTGLVEDTKCNLRFLSVLPPVQGIMDAVSKDGGGDELKVWIERFSVILESLIRTKSQIISASFFRLLDGSCASEICAVSRHANDSGSVKRVPNSRLKQLTDDERLDGVQEAGPDDVLLTVVKLFQNKKSMTGMVLQGDLPVFHGGELFGFLSVKVEPSVAFSHDYANKALGSLFTWVFDSAQRQIVGKNVDIPHENFELIQQLLQTGGCSELESTVFCGQKIEFEDVPGRVFAVVVCASTLSNQN